MKKEKAIVNARTINNMRCIVGLILSSIVIVLTIVSLTLNIINFYNEGTPEAGIGTLRMYTTLSNILATLAAATCLPFQIDGLRKNRYKLPKWVVEVMYIGAVGTFVTLVMVLTIVAPTTSYSYALLENSNIFMHTLNPIFITLLFIVAMSNVKIKFSHTFIAIIPTFIYALLYFILAVITDVWRDHYHIQDIMPWPIAFIILMAVAFLIALLLRFLHNNMSKYINKYIEKYYKESPDFAFENITAAIAKLAKDDSAFYSDGDDVTIPVDIIKMLSERYNTSTLPLDIQYDIYLENFLIGIHQRNKIDN